MAKKERLFKQYISEYTQCKDDDEREVVRLKVWDELGENRATLITDMTGFTHKSHQYGSVHYLSMIAMVEEVVREIVTAYEGVVVKCEADNTFNVFKDAKEAIDASFSINRALEKKNISLDEKFHLAVSCGVAYGTILVLENDIYGQSVIIASKLGEDVAKKGEVLVSKEAFDSIDKTVYTKTQTTLELSKVEVECYYISEGTTC